MKKLISMLVVLAMLAAVAPAVFTVDDKILTSVTEEAKLDVQTASAAVQRLDSTDPGVSYYPVDLPTGSFEVQSGVAVEWKPSQDGRVMFSVMGGGHITATDGYMTYEGESQLMVYLDEHDTWTICVECDDPSALVSWKYVASDRVHFNAEAGISYAEWTAPYSGNVKITEMGTSFTVMDGDVVIAEETSGGGYVICHVTAGVTYGIYIDLNGLTSYIVEIIYESFDSSDPSVLTPTEPSFPTDPSVPTDPSETIDPNECTHMSVTYKNNGDGTHNIVCTLCGMVLSTEECDYDSSPRGDSCTCGAKEPVDPSEPLDSNECPHGSGTYQDNGDGTHSKVCNVCGYVTHTAECEYSVFDDACAWCGAEMEPVDPDECTHSSQSYEDNRYGTHNILCTLCGTVLSTEECDYDSSPFGDSCWCGAKEPIDPDVCDHQSVFYEDNGDGTHNVVCLYCYLVLDVDECVYGCEGGCMCGAEDPGNPLDPNECTHGVWTLEDNGDGTHSFVCVKCGAKVSGSESTDPSEPTEPGVSYYPVDLPTGSFEVQSGVAVEWKASQHGVVMFSVMGGGHITVTNPYGVIYEGESEVMVYVDTHDTYTIYVEGDGSNALVSWKYLATDCIYVYPEDGIVYAEWTAPYSGNVKLSVGLTYITIKEGNMVVAEDEGYVVCHVTAGVTYGIYIDIKGSLPHYPVDWLYESFDSSDPSVLTPTDPSVPADPSEPEDTKPGTVITEGTLTDTKEELMDKVPLTEEEKQEIAGGAEVELWIEMEDISDAVSEEEKTLITEAIAEELAGGTVATYLDIEMFKQVGDNDAANVSVLDDKVTITFKLPEELINTDGKVSRTYIIVHVHDGVAEVINPIFDEETQTLTLQTSKFSTYAVVYIDEDVTGPSGTAQGGDKSALIAVIAACVIGVVSIAVLPVIKKRF